MSDKLKPKKWCKCEHPSRYNPYIKKTHCIKCGKWIKEQEG